MIRSKRVVGVLARILDMADSYRGKKVYHLEALQDLHDNIHQMEADNMAVDSEDIIERAREMAQNARESGFPDHADGIEACIEKLIEEGLLDED